MTEHARTWLIHFTVQRKLTHYKAIILQLKKKEAFLPYRSAPQSSLGGLFRFRGVLCGTLSPASGRTAMAPGRSSSGSLAGSEGGLPWGPGSPAPRHLRPRPPLRGPRLGSAPRPELSPGCPSPHCGAHSWCSLSH